MHIRPTVDVTCPQPSTVLPLMFYLFLAALVANLPMQEAATWHDHP